MARIARIDCFSVPPRWLFVRVECDDGAVGWGEASLEGHSEAVEGAFHGLRDRFVGRALTLLHSKPAHPWTLEELAREVGLSRSSLAERFAHFVGEPPMHYLARWRMQMAATLLSGGSASVGAIAEEVGYASEAAFNRSFKKLVGAPPAAWRWTARPGACLWPTGWTGPTTSAPP